MEHIRTGHASASCSQSGGSTTATTHHTHRSHEQVRNGFHYGRRILGDAGWLPSHRQAKHQYQEMDDVHSQDVFCGNRATEVGMDVHRRTHQEGRCSIRTGCHQRLATITTTTGAGICLPLHPPHNNPHHQSVNPVNTQKS